MENITKLDFIARASTTKRKWRNPLQRYVTHTQKILKYYMVFLNYMMFMILTPLILYIYFGTQLSVYDFVFVFFFLKNNPSKPEGEDDLKWRVGPEPLDFNIKFKLFK